MQKVFRESTILGRTSRQVAFKVFQRTLQNSDDSMTQCAVGLCHKPQIKNYALCKKHIRRWRLWTKKHSKSLASSILFLQEQDDEILEQRHKEQLATGRRYVTWQ